MSRLRLPGLENCGRLRLPGLENCGRLPGLAGMGSMSRLTGLAASDIWLALRLDLWNVHDFSIILLIFPPASL